MGKSWVKFLLFAVFFSKMKFQWCLSSCSQACPELLGLGFGRGVQPLSLQAASGQSRELKDGKPKLGWCQLRVLRFGGCFQAFGWSPWDMWDSSNLGRGWKHDPLTVTMVRLYRDLLEAADAPHF